MNSVRKTPTTNGHLLASVRMLLDRMPPEYGSPAWQALSRDHPARMRAVWEAAEAWRHYWTPEAIAGRLRAELDQYDRIWLERFKAISADVSAVWDPARHCTGPSFLELQIRRATPSRGEPPPSEAEQIAQYSAALGALNEALNDSAISVQQAQRVAPRPLNPVRNAA